MGQKKASILFVIIFFAVFIIFSCNTNEFNGYWKYYFKNETKYDITVFIGKSYRNDPYDTLEKNDPFTLLAPAYWQINPVGRKTIYVDSNSVNFSWIVSDSKYNSYSVYCENNGDSVIFKER